MGCRGGGSNATLDNHEYTTNSHHGEPDRHPQAHHRHAPRRAAGWCGSLSAPSPSAGSGPRACRDGSRPRGSISAPLSRLSDLRRGSFTLGSPNRSPKPGAARPSTDPRYSRPLTCHHLSRAPPPRPSAASVVMFQPGYRGLQRWREVLAVGAPKTSGAARKKAIVALARRLAVDPFGFAQGTRCGGSPPAGSRPGNSGSPCGHAHEPGHEPTHWKKANHPLTNYHPETQPTICTLWKGARSQPPLGQRPR